jgi:hypothetical protein
VKKAAICVRPFLSPARKAAELSWSSFDQQSGQRIRQLSRADDRQLSRPFLPEGEKQSAVTADPEAGIIETYQGDRMVIPKGHVEVRVERKPPS